MQRIAVTGGSGGAGSHVILDLLARGYEVINLDRAKPASKVCPFIKIDLTNYKAVFSALTNCTAIVHLGANPSPDEDHATGADRFNHNTAGVFNVFNAAAALGIQRVIWASSDTVLGYPYEKVQPLYLPADELHPAQPQNGYALSKSICEELARQMSRAFGMTIIGLRFSNIHYPNPALRTNYGLVPGYWSDPRKRKFNLWGYVDVRDVAQSVRLSLKADIAGAEVFNIAAADTIMNRPSAELAAAVFPGVPVREQTGAFASLLSSARATAQLGYVPRYSWRDHVYV